MPRGFTDREKEMIKQKLYEKGMEFLKSYGVRKTNVEDITQAVGISKGSFYLFFNSKEEFFYELIEISHDALAKEAKRILLSEGPLENKIRLILKQYICSQEALGFLVSAEEIQYILRKLPAEKLEHHLAQDNDVFKDLLQAAGISLDKVNSHVVENLTKLIFLAQMNTNILDKSAIDETCDIIIEALIKYVMR